MFKNLMLYRVTKPETLRLLRNKHLDSLLTEHPARDPQGGQWRTFGFGPSCSTRQEFVFESGQGHRMFVLYTAERNLPGAVIREHVNIRAAKIEEREGRKCYRNERAQLRDEVEAELLPKAFIKRGVIRFMLIGDVLVLDCSSAKKADDALSVLRTALGSLGVRPITPNTSLRLFMTDLARNRFDSDTGFTVLSSGKLDDGDGGKISLKDAEITQSDEVQALFDEAGYGVSELALAVQDEFNEAQARFVLTEKMIVKGFKLDGLLMEVAASKSDEEDAAAFLDATMVIFGATVKLLVDRLIDAVGEYIPPVIGVHDESSDEYLVSAAQTLVKLGAQYLEDHDATVVQDDEDDDL